MSYMTFAMMDLRYTASPHFVCCTIALQVLYWRYVTVLGMLAQNTSLCNSRLLLRDILISVLLPIA